MPSIDKSFTNTIQYHEEISKEAIDGPISVAIENIPCGMTEETNSSHGYIIVTADSEEELEEKTMEVLSFIEHYSKNRILQPEISDDTFNDSITGFNIAEKTKGYHDRKSYNWNPSEKEKKYSLNDHITSEIPKNSIIFEDEETGEELVLFYHLYNDVIDENDCQENIDIDLEDNPLNENVKKLNLLDDDDNQIVAYGDAVILTMDIAQEYYTFN